MKEVRLVNFQDFSSSGKVPGIGVARVGGWTEDIPIMIPMGLVSNLYLRLTSVSDDGGV